MALGQKRVADAPVDRLRQYAKGLVAVRQGAYLAGDCQYPNRQSHRLPLLRRAAPLAGGNGSGCPVPRFGKGMAPHQKPAPDAGTGFTWERKEGLVEVQSGT